MTRVVVPAACGTEAAYRRHLRNGETPCADCRDAQSAAQRARNRAQSQGPGYGSRHEACDLWPGITAGMDSRCSCTRAPLNGLYQVKVRDTGCLNHGGPLDAVLARMARWGVRGGD